MRSHGVEGWELVTELLERDDEVRTLAHLVQQASGGDGGCLCIEGPPGIGKSALLSTAVALARERGMNTLTARGGELEVDFPLGVVRQLFEESIAGRDHAEQARIFVGAAALAAPALGQSLPRRESSLPPDPVSATVHGLYWLTVNLLEEAPLLLVVDDAHWADSTSLRFLAYLARRLESLRAALVVAVREEDQTARRPALDELRATTAQAVASPGTLSEQAVGRLLVRVCGAKAPQDVSEAVHSATGGNPFLVQELAMALMADAVPLDGPDTAERIRGLAPRTVWRSIVVRVSRLHPAAGDVLRAVAVLGEHAALTHVARLAKVERSEASTAAAQLVRAGLLRDGLPLAFAHPILRSSAYADMVAVERAEWHARAAELLAATGGEPDAVAGQLLLSAPDGNQDAVNTLRAAASAAVARGAAETAVAYLRRALVEPVDDRDRPALLHELGRTEILVRDPAAVEHLHEARALARGPVERARYAHDLAGVLSYGGQWSEVSHLLTNAIAELGDRDEALRLRLAALAMALTHHPRYTQEFDRQLPEVLTLIESHAPEARALRLYLALALSARGRNCERVPDLVAAGWDDGAFVADEGSESLGSAYAIHALIHVDHLADARSASEVVIADARARGSVLGFVNGIGTRALGSMRAGALMEAEADARSAIELTREHELFLIEPYVVAYLADVLRERERLDEAAALVERASIPEHFARMTGWATLLDARARVRLAQGDRDGAIAAFREAGSIWKACEVRNPNVSSWRSELALVVAADDAESADALIEDELADARRAGSARALGIGLRARGILAGGRAGLQDLGQAVAKLERSPAVLERARALADLGAALRRANRRSDAREPLQRARELAHRCGAVALASRAERELRATGSRPRRLALSGSEALTPSERRVAALAASGLANREIAQQLFVTVNTVESHLRAAYLKLGIKSRKQLRSTLSEA